MGLGQRLQDWRDRRRIDDEIGAMPDAEIEALGLTRADLRDVARISATQVARMETMAGLFGAGAALDADPVARAAAAVACAHCDATRACTEELTRPAGPRADHCGFCPNAGTYRDLAKG